MEGFEFLMKVDAFYPMEDTPWYSKENILDYRLYGKAIGSITKFMLREYYNEDDIVWHNLKVFPSKIITVYDYKNDSITGVKVNASFVSSQRDTLLFYLPYL